MLIVTLLNLSTKVLSDSPFSWRMPTRAMEVRWCGRLFANWVSNFATSVAKLSMELGEFGEPTKGCSLQGCGKHPAQHGVVRGVETHMGGVGVHMLVRVGRPVVSVSVDTLLLLKQWDFDDGVGKGVSTVRVGHQGRPGGPD